MRFTNHNTQVNSSSLFHVEFGFIWVRGCIYYSQHPNTHNYILLHDDGSCERVASHVHAFTPRNCYAQLRVLSTNLYLWAGDFIEARVHTICKFAHTFTQISTHDSVRSYTYICAYIGIRLHIRKGWGVFAKDCLENAKVYSLHMHTSHGHCYRVRVSVQ